MNGAFRDLARGGCGADRIESAANGPVSPNPDWTDLGDESSKMCGQLLPDAGVCPGAGGRAPGQEEPQRHLPPQGGTYYGRTKHYVPYDSMQACLDSGGRAPKR
ncbi:hypothetical protein D3C80_1675780 [compost metagenome]